LSDRAFDYDVIVIGSGFGGSVAALRAVEKGYSVVVLEAGRRWREAELPRTSWDVAKFAWQPEFGLYGIQRVHYLDDVIVMSAAGVGGGSLVCANALRIPRRRFFDAPVWSHITDWANELAPYYDQSGRMFGAMPSPYLDSDGDRLVRGVAAEMGRPYRRAALGIYFGTPGVEVDDPYFGGAGPTRTGCVGCAGCLIGCPHNAKNMLTANYLHLAQRGGAVIYELQEAYELAPLDGRGYAVTARCPGPLGRLQPPRRYTGEHVVVAAHAYGTAQLLLRMKHHGMLGNLSDKAGRRTRTNAEALISVQRSESDFKRDPQRHHIVPGVSAATGAIQLDAASTIGAVYYGVGNDAVALLYTAQPQGRDEQAFRRWLRQLIEHPGEPVSVANAVQWSQRGFNLLCLREHDDGLDLYWKDGVLRSKPGIQGSAVPILDQATELARRVAERLGGQAAQVWFAVADRATSAHFVGGMPIGDDAGSGVVDPYQRAFGHPGLHVMDGSVIAANPGANPSLTIAALAERAMSFWPNRGDADPRPPLGAGYQRLKPVPPRHPVVPAGAPGEYRLEPATIEEVAVGGP
jgi:cholesterol oxidase